MLSARGRSERLSRAAEAAMRALVVLCMAGSVFGAGRAVVRKAQAASAPERFLVVSSRPHERDAAFRELASQTAVLMYTRADSALARKLAEWKEPPGPLAVYVERDGKTVSVSSRTDDLARAVEAASLSVAAQEMPQVFVGAMAGAFVGVFLPASPAVLGLLLLGGAGACLLKARLGCLACDRAYFQAVPLEALGSGAYTAGSAIALAGKLARPVVGLAAGTALAVQVAATLASDTACAPCGVVAAVNSALLLCCSGARAKQPAGLGWGWPALAGAAGLACTALALQPRATRGPDDELRHPTAWKGRLAAELGPIELPKQGRKLVAVWSRDCEPCRKALERLAQTPDLPADLYRAVRPGSPASGDDGRTIRLGGRLDRTPAFFVVEASGRIVSEYYGWSDSPEWERAFFRAVRADLEPADSGKMLGSE